MFSAVESMPVWQQGNAMQPTKPMTKPQNINNSSNPTQRTSNSIPSPQRNQTLLNSLSISVDRAKNVPPGTINSAGGTSKKSPNSTWGKNILGNIQPKSDAQAILNNYDNSERNHVGDRKSYAPTRLSGVTTRHQIQRNENKVGNVNPKLGSPPNQSVLGPLVPSGYSQTKHFSGASHWQITEKPNGNQASKPTRISAQQTGNGFGVVRSYAINKDQVDTSYLEGQSRGLTGYTSYIPGKNGQPWKVTSDFKILAKPTTGNCSKRDTLENHAKSSDSIRSPRSTTVGSSRSVPFPKVSPYGPMPVANTGGSPRGQSSLISSTHKTVSPRHLGNSKRVIPGIKNTNETSGSSFNSQKPAAWTDMKRDTKQTENNKKITHSNNDSLRANGNSKPPFKTSEQRSSMPPMAKSFRKVKSQFQMAIPKSKSLYAKEDNLRESQKGAQKSRLFNGKTAHTGIPKEDDDSDEEMWSKTIFDRGNLVKSAEKWMPHLLSDYQTLFPAVSPTCLSIPSVVTSQGDRQAGIPRRVRAHPPKRTSSPTNYLSRMLGLGNSASYYGSPLWRPIQRPSCQKLNDNNNNAHSVQPRGIHVILEDLAEEQIVITESTTPMENNINGHKSALAMRPNLDAIVSKVTSSQDVSLEDLRVNLKHSLYSQQNGALTKAGSTAPDCVRMDTLEQAVDDAISTVQAQREAAAQKVASLLANLLLVSVDRRRKQKKAQTFQSVISKFWESDI